MLPVMLDLAGKRVVVVGGGAVGRRKAAAAAAAGAAVTVVDPAASAGPWDCAAEPYHPRHLDGAALVFAAAPPQVNARVLADAVARGVWANSATDPAAGDFFLMATTHAGGLTVAVGTAGAAPALARRVRDKLAAEFDAAFADWVALLDEIRPLVQARVPDPAARRRLLDGFADWPWLTRVRAEGVEAVRAAMAAAVRGAPPP